MRLLRRMLLVLLVAFPVAAGSVTAVRQAALATISPYATQTGVEVLREGGNAADAAVAVAFALAVAYPQAGNLGGGGFLLYYDASSGAVWSLDFREVAPQRATRTMYLDSEGRAKENASTLGASAVGVPGTVAGLEAFHLRFGSTAWKDLVQPSILLAKEGVRVDAELAEGLRLAKEKRHIDQFPSTSAVFYPGGEPLAEGSVLVQSDLARTLERVAEHGGAELYDGQTARLMVRQMESSGGLITARDLKDYSPIWRAPLRIDFRGVQIFTMGPPSGGGLVMAETLQLLSKWDLKRLGAQSPAAIHLLVEATRRAYIDRNLYVGDPESTRVPLRELLSDERARQWRSSIDPGRASATTSLKEPGTWEPPETTHFSVIDAQGNVAAVTTTLNGSFGSGLVVDGAGFLLNNEMDDFMTAPGQPNLYGLVQSEANAIVPGRRMASSMAPTIVLRDGRPLMVLGTPGGATIPTTILQVLLGVLVHNLPLDEAVAAPRYHHQGVPDRIDFERGRANPDLLTALEGMGHALHERSDIGDVEAVMVLPDGIQAVSDPRNGGAAGGF